MAVKRAKTSRPGSGAKKKASSKAPANVTKLSTARKKLASQGPTTVRKKKPAASKAPAVTAPKQQPVVSVVEHALDEMKAVNVKVLAVNKLTDITDTMIIASGNSDRHVRSIADRVVEHAKKAGVKGGSSMSKDELADALARKQG